MVTSFQAGAKVSEIDSNETTPLFRAVEEGLTEVALQLIAAGADVNQTDREGRTPLMVAAEKGFTALAEALLDAGDRT